LSNLSATLADGIGGQASKAEELMAGAPATRPKRVDAIGSTSVADPTTSRALDDIRDLLGRVQSTVRRFDVVTYDLVSGLNKVPHKLGRPCVAALVVPSVAAADFAYAAADQSANRARETTVHVTLSGTAQPGAVLLVM